MAKSTFVFLTLVSVSGVLAFSEINRYRPVIWSKLMEKGKPAFHGEIKENERIVQLKPKLSASDADQIGGARFICKYEITSSRKHPRSKPLPFVIVVTNKLTGEAEIRVKEGEKLSSKNHPYYKFGIKAEDCGSPAKQSAKAYVLIKVLDVDEFAPKFDSDSYFAYVEEGKMYDSIVKIHASDEDDSEAFKTICGYELLTTGVPFEITPLGDVRNKEPLDYNIHRNFILEAVATDCGGRKSEPVFINLAVKERCRSGWTGLRDVISYRAGSGQQRLAEGATLKLCDGDCSPAQVNVKLTLSTTHIGKGCDRDTYSVNSQRKLCGASGDSVDLLPSPESADWSHNIPTDDGHEMDQVFAFDGENSALEVPEAVFDHMLHKHFTISAWLRHGKSEVSSQIKAPKEHVLCMGDGDGMNRHHYGLYIHGEKLVLLLRREAEDVGSPKGMQVFRPAEFRWHIPQVTDDQWHHFAVSVDLQEGSKDGGVRLYVDGKLLLTDGDNFEIIDDWPLHRSKKVHSTKLVVGACWQGTENTFAHYYKGYMAGLFVLKGKTESDRVIKCLNNCKENLDFHAISDMSSGTSVSFNSEMTEFTISSRSVEEVNRLMGQVAYVNARSYPTPGYRTFTIETSLLCEGQTVVLPLLEKRILVEEQQDPVFIITGYSNLTRMVYEFERGLRVFHDIHIFARVQPPEEEMEEDSNDVGATSDAKAAKLAQKLSKTLLQQSTEPKNEEFMIDECHVLADPELNLFIEHLSLPTHLMEIHGLEWTETNSGVVIRNADTIPNYENVIRNIHYYHSEPEKLANRTLTLYCSSQNQRFISTKFIERLVAVHQAAPPPAAANAQSNSFSVHQSLKGASSDGHAAVVADSSNLGMIAIIVVCVGFLLFMIILGVIRIRAAHRRTHVVHMDDRQEMEWDNSALNITINPMEQEMFEYEDGVRPTFPEDSDSEEDEESSMQGDYGDSTEDEEPVVQVKGAGGNELEWDNTSF